MTEHDQPSDDRAELTRRALIGGAAALGGAGLISLASPSGVSAAPTPAAFPDALAATLPGLTYISLDGLAFHVASTEAGLHRVYQEVPATGVQPSISARYIYAELPIPLDAAVRQVNVSYQGQPTLSIARRDFTTGAVTEITPPLSTDGGGGVKTKSFSVNATLTHGASYVLRAFCAGGDSILGTSVGYVPPTQAFVPYTGAAPRVLDTREPGQGGAFAADEARPVDLSSKLVAGARSAIINITATGTQGPGWFAVFRDGISYPGNSSLNWFGPGQIVANNVVTAVTAGKIQVHCGPAGSHCVIDVIGSLI